MLINALLRGKTMNAYLNVSSDSEVILCKCPKFDEHITGGHQSPRSHYHKSIAGHLKFHLFERVLFRSSRSPSKTTTFPAIKAYFSIPPHRDSEHSAFHQASETLFSNRRRRKRRPKEFPPSSIECQ